MDARSLPLAALALALLLTPPPAAAGDDPESARRLLGLLGGVAQEYEEAFDAGGALVRPMELEEARLLLAEARDHGRRLGPTDLADLEQRLAALADAIEARAPATVVTAQTRAIREAVQEATGVSEEIFPPAPASSARGGTLFQTHCGSCHGERGAGDGPEARRLEWKPANFTDPAFMRGETPTDFFHVISLGRRQVAMPAWEDVLSVQDRWDVISHLWSLGTTPQALAEGQGVFVTHCATCHGEDGDGRGPYADRLLTPTPDWRALERLAGRSDADLYAAVSDGVPGTPMPAFRDLLTEQERWKAAAFVRALSLGRRTAAGADTGTVPSSLPAGSETAAGKALAEVRRRLAAAVDAFRNGEARAGDLATDAYLSFEPLEPRIAAGDASVVRRVEEGFLRLRPLLRHPGAGVDVERTAATLRRDLEAAEATQRPRTDAYARFVQSASIILREGLEVVLIIGALLAWVTRTDSAALRRPIYVGTGLGVLASVATAVLLATIFRLTPGLSDMLEGIAMLLAAVVLFWVSYWIISKAEAERWQRYLRDKVERAVESGNGMALAAAAFLAVYREGFETVLFYQALLGGHGAGDVWVAAGFLTGAALLALVYGGFKRFGLRLPIRQFFLVTGGFLCVMAIAMAGKGVHELQEVGAVAVTPIEWVPHIDVLGVFPTVESLIAQGVLVGLVLCGVAFTVRAGREREAADAPGVRAEAKRLRELAEVVRADVKNLRAVEDAASPAILGARLDALIACARDLEARAANARR